MKHFDETLDWRGSPIIGLDDEYPPGFVDPLHTHGHAQLLYASSGVMSVTADNAAFVIPPQRAIWLPAGLPHEVSCRGHVSLRTLYFDESHTGLAERPCQVIEVTDFLRALIVEMSRVDKAYGDADREMAIARVLINELKLMPSAPYRAPMPTDPRLLRVCQRILEDPAAQADLDELAHVAAMSRRTFTRQFKAEVGMGLAVWRQQVRLMAALSMLAAGEPVTSVAFAVGYDSPSAFSALFRRSFGAPPSEYALN
ncbi:MAG TPA: helix-turn-helix transcriptional regulator [Caulobacteraceae bacterium]|nr:helix-turn-helix transcriptional regulator [Caulobacteraceae bacterium]